MGLVHYIFRLPCTRLEGINNAVTEALNLGSTDDLLKYLDEQGILARVIDELDSIEVVIKPRSFFRRKEVRWMNPLAGLVIEQVLSLLAEDLDAARICDPDKAFMLLKEGHYDVKLQDIPNLGLWFTALDLGLEPPPEHLRVGDVPDYGFIPHSRCKELALITDAISGRCEDQEDYLTGALQEYSGLLRSCKPDEKIVVIIS